MADSSSKNKNNIHGRDADRRGSDPTIVGGRPLRRSQLLHGIPRGIEVLIKKASVDPEFRLVLLEKRAKAAVEIELELSAAEAAMLDAIPAAQIKKIIENAKVPDEHRRAFLGKVAATMLAVLGLPLSVCSEDHGKRKVLGADDPSPPRVFGGYSRHMQWYGNRPDEPPQRSEGTYRTQHGFWVFEPVRVDEKNERLFAKMVSEQPNSIVVDVNFDCPFDHGEITIRLSKNRLMRGADMTYKPVSSLISRGKGEVRFSVEGTRGTTEWLIVRLRNKSKECQASWDLRSDLRVSEGEYSFGDCALVRFIWYRKVWPA